MNTYIFESALNEIRITIIAADEYRAHEELKQKIELLHFYDIDITSVYFELTSAY